MPLEQPPLHQVVAELLDVGVLTGGIGTVVKLYHFQMKLQVGVPTDEISVNCFVKYF